jgi:subtilase family serine protease
VIGVIQYMDPGKQSRLPIMIMWLLVRRLWCVVVASVVIGEVIHAQGWWRGAAVTGRAKLEGRHDLSQRQRVHPSVLHDVIVATKSQNIDFLTQLIEELADPKSPKFGKYLTDEELNDITGTGPASETVINYFADKDVEIVDQKIFGEFITVRGAISVWEDLLQTQFYHFDRVDFRKGSTLPSVVRSLHYTIPAELTDAVDAIFMTSQMPPMTVHSTVMPAAAAVSDDMMHRQLQQGTGSLTPSVLRSFCKY